MNPDADLLAADREARTRALETHESFIVQAPAGSGKTELLIQRYLTLLSSVDEPEEILAITFTRKAAAEMRVRVVDALQRAQRGDPARLPHEEVTLQAAQNALARDRDREWQLAANVQRMRIQTMDALNASIARMLPLTQSATGASPSIAEDTDLETLYADAAAATLDWLGDSGANGQAAETVLRHLDNNTNRFIAYVAAMLGTRDQWLPFISSGLDTAGDSVRLRKALERSLAKMLRTRLSDLQEHLPTEMAAEFLALGVYAANNLLAADEGDHPIAVFATQPMPPEIAPDCGVDELRNALAWWRGLCELLLVQNGNFRKQVNKNQGFPPGDDGQKAQLKAVLDDLPGEEGFRQRLAEVRQLPGPEYSDRQWQVLLALFRLLPVAVAELRRLSLAQGVTDHIEVALSAGSALGTADEPGDMALLFDYQLRHILVDEMQDTSRGQYHMLEALTGGWQTGDGRTLFVVGDPMQSIYRFRNAEVAQFLLARTAGIGQVTLEPLVLRRNFRSGSTLVDWYNRAFPQILPLQDDVGQGAVAYSEAVSVEAQRGKGECIVHPLFGAGNEAEAIRTGEVIRSLLDTTDDDSIAVLVRSRTHLPVLLRQLRHLGIGYQAIDIDRLSDLPEIIDVLALARAMLHSGDRVAWLAVLRSPWAGLDWADLHALVFDAPTATVPELLQDAARLKSLSPAGQAAVGQLMQRLQPYLRPDRASTLQRRVERAWFALGGPALLPDANAVANVYHFFDTLAKFESGGSIPDVVAFLQQLDRERVSSSVASRVQIMTMHKAKGLQFDHVILHGLGRFPASSRKAVLSWFDATDDDGSEYTVISPVGPEDEVENDLLHQFIGRTRQARDDLERSRLLYVACTRAKQSLHLVGHVGIGNDGETLKPPDRRSLLSLLCPIVQSDFEDAFDASAATGASDDEDLWVQPP
ncbi:MAG: UvrD-helicase domain-containing protein, partial [Woeseiaceae bacterium]|nr:UvrD-helicase domain-containing protein [Woeseiaceae bacterium]